ncbi:hypothetical protein OG912_22620 [Streptomyces sp. NBC_00464]|uniref:hypothetical protein n=1 Tax=Streptomyces sp. NBC_00464 TaxID=2975751 RepID=UPI002E19A7D7
MSTDDPGTPDGDRSPPRPWNRGNPGPGNPPRPPHPPTPPGTGGPTGHPPPAGGRMPAPVSSLRVMMMILGGLQAVLGLALVTNSVAVATEIWGEADASTPCCRTPGEAHSGTVVFVGVLIMAVAAWGILTALKFPTRQPGLRNSAMVYSWTGLPFALAAFQVAPILGVIVLILAILLTVRPNQPECRAWFGG